MSETGGLTKKTKKGVVFFKKSIWIIVVILVIVICLGLYILLHHNKKKEPYFQNALSEYFYIFNDAFPDQEDYRFHSLEVYCLENDENMAGDSYYVHSKYTGYIDVDDKWVDIEEVFYGVDGHLAGFFCLNWNSLEGFEKQVEQYQKAVKEGIKKTYTLGEIQEMIDKYKPEG